MVRGKHGAALRVQALDQKTNVWLQQGEWWGGEN